jgi:DnaA family protein
LTLEQLVFELAAPEPPRLANFLPGRNAELLATLERFVRGATAETGLFLWGAPGAGKTHLLYAAKALAEEHGGCARIFPEPGTLTDADAAPGELLLIDRIDEADAVAAGRIFTLFNALKEGGGRLVAAGRTPLGRLSLREDLRTRLGWGFVYELSALVDEDKPEALIAYARSRGFDLSGEVIDYLLRHGRRDMPSLVSALAALDRMSLATKRPVTVPLLREWLQKGFEWELTQSQMPARD